MGPAAEALSSSTTVKVVNLSKLKEDGSNWITYKEHILNTLMSKGLRRHVFGTAKKPSALVYLNGAFFKPNSLSSLSDDELEAYEQEVDTFDQKQAQVHEVIYKTISQSTFLQIKDGTTAAKIWSKLIAI